MLAFALLPAQPPTPDAEAQRHRVQEEAEARRQRLEEPHVSLGEALPEGREEDLRLPEETPSFRIDRIQLEIPAPVAARRFQFLERELERYRGRRIGPQGLRLILDRLGRALLARGYTTTRIDLKEQDLSQGSLRLDLIPGIVRSVRMDGPAGQGRWRAAFPVRPGDLLNLRDLEQGLEQMKRAPGQDVRIALTPGDRPGESDVRLTVTQGRAWNLALSVDDGGPPAIASWQGALQGTWGNPLGRSDGLNASLSHDLTAWRRGSGTRGASLGYTLPLGYWTFGVNGAWQGQDQRMEGTQGDLAYESVSTWLDLRVGWLFHRDHQQKNVIQFRTGLRRSRSFLAGTEIDVQRRRNSFAELALVHTRYLGAGQFSLSLAHRQGVPWFRAQADLGPEGPTFFYRLQTLEASLTRPLPGGFTYTGTLRAQRASSRLYASEQISLGDRTTVRGLEDTAAESGDRGFFLRNDLERPLGGSASWYLGLDGGRVQDPGGPGRTRAGLVLGLRIATPAGLSFHAFLGGAIGRPGARPVLGVSAVFHF